MSSAYLFWAANTFHLPLPFATCHGVFMVATVSDAKKLLGNEGETRAALFLQKKGWRVLARNWRPNGPQHGLELDIVAQKGPVLLFVEVKTRDSTRNEGISVFAVFPRGKQRKFLKAARQYLAAHDVWDAPCQFDLICCLKDGKGMITFEHYEHVIENWETLDSGNASWQPW